MARFDSATLDALGEAHEVAVRTGKHPDTAVVIWVAVAGGDVFVRSARGARGRWYRDLVEDPMAVLEVAGRQLAVRATPAGDPQSIERASRAYLKKYAPSPYANSIVQPEILATTLRLDPR